MKMSKVALMFHCSMIAALGMLFERFSGWQAGLLLAILVLYIISVACDFFDYTDTYQSGPNRTRYTACAVRRNR